MTTKEKIGIAFIIFLTIPVINVIATIFTPFFQGGTLNPGVVRGIILALFCLWFIFTRAKFNFITNSSYFFLAYLLLLCLVSESFLTSFYIYNKVFVASIFLPLSLHFISSENRFRYFIRSCLIALFLLELNFIISNILGIGFATYQDESILFGESGVNITKYMVIFIMILPFYLKYEQIKSYRILGIILLIVGIIIVILGMKRSAILAISAGFILYALFTPYKSRMVRIIPFAAVLVVLSGPYYIPLIKKRFESREQKVSMSYEQLQENEEEGRLLEVQYTMSQTFDDSFERIFIGYNLFMKKPFSGHKRMLHIDYMNMLGGAGLIGLSIFIFIYYKIWSVAKKIKKRLYYSKFQKEIYATIVALIGVQIFMSIGGTMQGLDLRGTILLILGALLGLSLQNLKKEVKSNE